MDIIRTKQLTEKQFQEIDRLWNEEYPLKLRGRFGILLDGSTNYDHYLIENEAQKVIAWAVQFVKDDETRFSIIVDSTQQRKGLGSLLLTQLKKDLTEFYGWVIDHNDDLKVNGEKYMSPLNFYLKQGFQILPDQRIDSEMLKAVKIKMPGKGASGAPIDDQLNPLSP